jgi:flavorubredoxin
MAQVDEIAENVFRISTYIKEFNLGFNQFLIKDDEPLLYHTGMKAIFPSTLEGVKKVIDPKTLRWVGFSHFEPDECGTLNEWLEIAPNAQAISSLVGASVYIDDGALRPAKILSNGEEFSTGNFKFKFFHTPHFPHNWDGSHLFEQSQRILFCSDLFHQEGNLQPLTESDITEAFKKTLINYQKGPFANYMPYHTNTQKYVEMFAALKPKILCPMHGSSFKGDGEKAILKLGKILKETLGPSN